MGRLRRRTVNEQEAVVTDMSRRDFVKKYAGTGLMILSPQINALNAKLQKFSHQQFPLRPNIPIRAMSEGSLGTI